MHSNQAGNKGVGAGLCCMSAVVMAQSRATSAQAAATWSAGGRWHAQARRTQCSVGWLSTMGAVECAPPGGPSQGVPVMCDTYGTARAPCCSWKRGAVERTMLYLSGESVGACNRDIKAQTGEIGGGSICEQQLVNANSQACTLTQHPCDQGGLVGLWGVSVIERRCRQCEGQLVWMGFRETKPSVMSLLA
jgi:hypothetical protein